MDNRIIKAHDCFYVYENSDVGVDMISGIYNVPLGHGSIMERNALMDAAKEPTCTYANLSAPGKRFQSILNEELDVDYNWVAYSNGAEIVERAVQMSVSPRSRLVAFEGAFHGKSFFSSKFHYETGYRWPFDVVIVPRNDLSQIPDMFDAIIFEPIQGWDGYRFSAEQMIVIKRRCQHAGATLIVDEIFCGLGRAGPNVVSSRIDPDILLVGKGLAGGTPGTALGYRDSTKLSAPFGMSSTFSHNHFIENVVSNLLSDTILMANSHSWAIGETAERWFPTARINGATIFINYREHGIDIESFAKKYKYTITNHDPWLKLAPCYTMPYEVLNLFFERLRKEITK